MFVNLKGIYFLIHLSVLFCTICKYLLCNYIPIKHFLTFSKTKFIGSYDKPQKNYRPSNDNVVDLIVDSQYLFRSADRVAQLLSVSKLPFVRAPYSSLGELLSDKMFCCTANASFTMFSLCVSHLIGSVCKIVHIILRSNRDMMLL